VEDLGRDSKAERRQLSNLPHQRDEAVAVVDDQLACPVVQLHQTSVGFQAGWRKQ